MNRVAVTTNRYDDVASAYAQMGLEPVSLPCIQTQPLPPGRIAHARERLSAAELLLITSPRVVSLLWPSGGMPDVETAVVGQSTAAAVSGAGGRVDVIGDAGLARLVELTADRLDGRRVVIAHAAGSDPVALSRLRQTTSDLEEHAVYRTTPVAPAADRVDAVAFASPSAVEGWSLSRSFDDVVVGVIGTTTAGAVTRHRDPDVVADLPSHVALAAAIATHMEAKV